MPFFNFNGKVFEDTQRVISHDSRGLRYGDGLFETMRLVEGRIMFAAQHFDRLWKGLNLFQFEIPGLWSRAKFETEIFGLAEKNKLCASRIRLTCIRAGGGLYEAVMRPPEYIIEAGPLPISTLNSNGLEICVSRDAVKAVDIFSNLKHNNCLPYIAGAIAARKTGCNDALILNSKGNVCESTIANLFIIKTGDVLTPSLDQGCIAGVMRAAIIEHLRAENMRVYEKPLTEHDVIDADEVFLTNSISPVRWVAALGAKKFVGTHSKAIFHSFLNRHSAFFPQ